MGANESIPSKKLAGKEETKDSQTPIRRNSQYTNTLNNMYISNYSNESSSAENPDDPSQNTTTDPEKSIECEKEDGPVQEPLQALEGLTLEEKVNKSEETMRQLWKNPHPSWRKITEVTKIMSERTSIDGQVCEHVKQEVKHDVDKKVYDVPMDNCHLRRPRNRKLRSCPDPWRRHGAHVKLCQIGGSIPEKRDKNSRTTVIRKGSNPPTAPKTKPLCTVDDYMKILKR